MNPSEEMRELLTEAYDSIVEKPAFKADEAKDITEKEQAESNDEGFVDDSVDEVEETQTEETQDDIDENEDSDEESNFAESLKGRFSKAEIELLKSIDDLDLRNRFVEEGIKQRSDLDRKRQELGESKKIAETLDKLVRTNNLPYNRQQYSSLVENYVNLDAMLFRDPAQAIKILAENAKVDLSKLVSVQDSVDDYDDYRLPEEIERDNRLKALEQKEQQRENQLKQQEIISAQREVNDFINARDDKGNLKYPHFDKVRMDMQLFFNDSYPDMTLEKAYQKAIMLNPELVAQRDADILRKMELEKKAKIEKAKKQKAQSVRSSKINVKTVNPDVLLEQAFDNLFNS